MKENPMLGKDGLTITSANHLANIAKEMYEAAECRLESLKLFSRDYMLAISGKTFRVENESEKAELNALSSTLMEIGRLKSLIAYLREAIKAKDKLNCDASFEEHIEQLVKEGRKDLQKPGMQEKVEFSQEFEKLSPEQKARYFTLEAKAATLGSFIHPEGAFSKARKEFFEHRKNPTKVSGKGQEAEINTYSSNFSADEVDRAFFSMQKEYRSIQAEFNKMKADLEEKVADANKALAEQSVAAMKLWVDARKLERLKYDGEVKSLKVVIPHNLKEIYEKVNTVANQK